MSQLNIDKQRELVNLFLNTPKKSLTLEMCEAAVEKDGAYIQFVPKRFLTKELCLKAVKSNPMAFLKLKKEYICKEVLKATYDSAQTDFITFDLGKRILSKISRIKELELSDLLDDEVVKSAVLYHPEHLRQAGFKKYLDNREIIESALKKDGSFLRYIPEEAQTKEHILNAIDGGLDIKNFYVTKRFMDDEIADALIVKASTNFIKLPQEKRTYERCLLAAKNGLRAKYIPSEYFDEEMAKAYIEGHGVLNRVPKNLITKELILKSSEVSASSLINFDSDLIDEELAYELMKKGVLFNYPCIRKNQSQRIVDLALTDIGNIAYVKPEFLTDEIVDRAIEANYLLANKIPQEFLTEERVCKLIDKGLDLGSTCVRENQTEKVIDKLIKKGGLTMPQFFDHHLAMVNQSFLTQDFFKKIIKRNPKLFKFIPNAYLNEELCYLAACEGECALDVSLVSYQSQRIVDKCFENKEWRSLRHVREEFRTEAIVKQAIEWDMSNILQLLDPKMQEQYLYECVCSGEVPMNYKYSEIISPRIAEKAMGINRESFKFFREKVKTEEVCKKAYEYRKDFVFYIPERFTTTEMWLEGVKYKGGMNASDIYLIPPKHYTEELMVEIVKKDYTLLEWVSEEFLTPELLSTLYQIDARILKYFNI